MAPFGDDDMARWSALELSPREIYDLALLEMRAAGWDEALADMGVDVLHHAVGAFLERHDHTAAAHAIGAAWLVLWHRVHPDVDWGARTSPG